MMAYALIDYDNAKLVEKEQSVFDVKFNVSRIATRCAQIVNANYADCSEVAIRFYGGWTDKANNLTAAGSWIYAALGEARGRTLGLRTSPEVAVNSIFSDVPRFVGLYRDGGQKMVDTLLVADMVWIASQLDSPVVLVSDDEDMLPGTVATKLLDRSVTVCRRRSLGEAMNDAVLSQLRINIEGAVA